MAKNISFLQYMQAHGNTPGPTQRPLLTGAVSGAIAELPAAGLLYWTGALAGAAERIAFSLLAVHLVHALIAVLAGMLYATVFKRAANDKRGGWLFGAAFGFLLWVFAPVTIWQIAAPRPVAVGTAAMGLFAAHVLYGIILGLLYPHVHARVHTRLKRRAENSPDPAEEIGRTIVHHPRPDFVSQSAKVPAGKH